jgi:putative RNA 2'-phosphotransferase
MERRLVRISRFLSYLLRHRPEAEGLSMDDQGWVAVQELLSTRGARQRGITHVLLIHVVAHNDKQRFEFDEDGQRIRARQGHSRTVSLDWTAVAPPDYLYHGTSSRVVAAIREEGLHKQDRHHVHLSPDAATAEEVGARHGQPVVLVIHAQAMHRAGYTFFISGNGIWLTEGVPPEFIDFP